ncbi:uncharacterized protein PAC_08398 [Phialocephala subalpina]|uniref:Heterokaryon incompatibility domain-containing protein n=1 Tax=Phialocephala subalpina TaxID=576137 RepID=A0A1L7X0F3_9HELO|nr:uncharacterized protein PAC_08398 [Phialocephala subalpina]
MDKCIGCYDKACSSNGIEKSDQSACRLIDVGRKCVVAALAGCQYLAFSYVWGDVRQPLLLRANCATLRMEGALDAIRPQPPRTIIDAMTLCKLLGEKYLWVDSLCLAQDELEESPDQIANMGLVYEKANATIVNASGVNSDAGLPGVGFPRAAVRECLGIQGANYATAFTRRTIAAESSKWNTRAWTLQEQYLSTRMLMFTDEQVFFAYREYVWFEDVVLETGVGGIGRSSREEKFKLENFDWGTRWLYMKPLGQSVEDSASDFYAIWLSYVGRIISYGRGMLRPFSGIMALYEPYLVPFHWGHPEKDFSSYFNWGMENCKSRRVKDFPSWSWAGWQHNIEGEVSRGRRGSRRGKDCLLDFYLISEKEMVFTPVVEAQKKSRASSTSKPLRKT